MIRIGLTGSIGMGKSTTLAMFAARGARTWSADAAVHRLYAPGGAAVDPVSKRFPGVLAADGGVDRATLSAALAHDPSRFSDLEAIVFPLVQADEAAFLRQAKTDDAPFVVLEAPLLFETGADADVDAVVVATAPAAVQASRVLARPGMDEAKFACLAARQVPDREKRARADYIVDTSQGLDAARRAVERIVAEIGAPGWRATRRRT